jgi:tRNA modification GTPase
MIPTSSSSSPAIDLENSTSDTIAAISTPAGEGAIALVRISGPTATTVADKIFRGREKPSDFPSHTQRLGHVVDGERIVDQVMVAVHRAPASYTGEDLVEISCHGGILVSAQVLATCVCAGARAAGPGEFTERAFLNGKIDLTQAEAVMDLIRAQTDLALRSATEQLEGRLGETIGKLREQLIGLIAQVDASIDFPDEDVEPDDRRALLVRLDSIREHLNTLLASANQGRILREGVRVVIYGAANAGKSSLLNRLLGYDRAIVSDIPGTTRDTIEESVNLRDVRIRFVDTAGLQPLSDDRLEKAGMARTEKSLRTADLLLHVADSSQQKPADFDAQPKASNEILVLNKSDLAEHADWKNCDALRISCVVEDGLRGLDEAILERIGAGNLRSENTVAINTRHHECLRRALTACDRARSSITDDVGVEYVAVDLRAALNAVGEVVRPADSEDILDQVFNEFCIGK